MLRRRTWSRLRTASRTATAWLLVVAYSAAALGVPLPLPTQIDATSSTPFPCQAHRCGCRTAEQCWKSCCCHTNREKLAWAAEHGVTPPSYVVVAAQFEAPACKTRRCCSHDHASTGTPIAKTPSVGKTAPAKPLPNAARSGVTWISAFELGRCRGAAPVWHNVPISLPPEDVASAPAFEPCVRPLSGGDAVAPFCPWFAPPDPPPWVG